MWATTNIVANPCAMEMANGTAFGPGLAVISSFAVPMASIHWLPGRIGENQSAPNAWPATTVIMIAM